MSDKKKTVARIDSVGVFRKNDITTILSNNSIKQRSLTYRAKPKEDLNPLTTRSELNRNKSATNTTSRFQTAPISQKRVASACSSNGMPNSGSLSHKPGYIPAYLRNKTNTKSTVTTEIQSNRKQFIQIKKELMDFQNKAIECYKRYRESLVKLNKLNGKDDLPTIDELKIIAFNEKYDEMSTPPIVSTSDIKFTQNNSGHRLKQITGEKILSDIAQQVQRIHVPSFKLLQDFSERLSYITNQMKLADNSGGGDTNIFPEKIQHLFEEIKSKIVEEEALKNTQIQNFMDNLKEVIVNLQCTSEVVKCDDKLAHHQKSTEKEMNAALIETQAKLHDRAKEFDKVVAKIKHFELTNKRLEKQLEEKTVEAIAKDKSIVKLKNTVESMNHKLMKYINKIQELENNDSDEQYKYQLEWLKSKYEEQVKSLRFQLNELNLCMADDSRTVREENMKLRKNEKLLLMEIDCLKINLKEILQKKPPNKQSKTEENEFRREIERRDEEINRMNTTIIEMENELNKREIVVEKKNRQICDLESRAKQFEEEIIKLKKTNNDKSIQIEQLQNDLSKVNNELNLQKESLDKQKQLLDTRSELIVSLQQISIDIKSCAENQSNVRPEETPKKEEIEIVTSPQIESSVERQIQIIKLLEETHEKMRVTFQRKITYLENQNAELKRCMIEFNNLTKNSTNETSNEIILRPCTNFYENWRQQKRKAATFIKVKKYKN